LIKNLNRVTPSLKVWRRKNFGVRTR